MIENVNHIEIGRGAKLIPLEYWHQYILKIDPSKESDFLIVSEVGKDKILFEKNISIDDIENQEWNDLVEISATTSFVNELIENRQDNEKLEIIIEKTINLIKENKRLLNGNWISINEYNDLNYNSNFGNWVDASPIKGKLKFGLDLNSIEQKNCKVEIPVNYWTMGDGYYSIKYGKFELTINQILIWENGVFPHQIKYSLVNNILTLNLFENEIQFVKE
jgi:hypothetical protein